MRQAVRLASGVSVLLGAWRHGVLCQAVTRKQWVWGGAGARRSGAFSPGDVWAEPGGDAVVLCFLVCCLTDNDALLGSGDAVP